MSYKNNMKQTKIIIIIQIVIFNLYFRMEKIPVSNKHMLEQRKTPQCAMHPY